MPNSKGKGRKSNSKKRHIVSSSSEDEDIQQPAGEEPIYTIEGILRRKTDKDGSLRYLIKWLGYDAKDNTWEPEDDLPKYWLAEFNRAEDLKEKNGKMRKMVLACVKEVDPNFPEPEGDDEGQIEKALEGLKKAQQPSTACPESEEKVADAPPPVEKDNSVALVSLPKPGEGLDPRQVSNGPASLTGQEVRSSVSAGVEIKVEVAKKNDDGTAEDRAALMLMDEGPKKKVTEDSSECKASGSSATGSARAPLPPNAPNVIAETDLLLKDKDNVIATLKKEVAALKDDCYSLKMKYADKEAELKGVRGHNENFKFRLREDNKKITSLEAELKSKELELENKWANNTKKMTEINVRDMQMQKQITVLQLKVKEKSDKILALETEEKRLNDLLLLTKTEFENQLIDLNDKFQIRVMADKDKDVKILTLESEGKSLKLDKLHMENEFAKRLKELNRKLSHLVAADKGMRAKIAKLESELKAARDQLHHQTKKWLAEMEKRIEVPASPPADVQPSEGQAKIVELESKVKELQKELDAKKILSMISPHTALNTKKAELERKITELENELKKTAFQLRMQKEVGEEKVNKLQQWNSKLVREQSGLEKKLKEIETAKNTLEKELSEAKDSLEEMLDPNDTESRRMIGLNYLLKERTKLYKICNEMMDLHKKSLEE